MKNLILLFLLLASTAHSVNLPSYVPNAQSEFELNSWLGPTAHKQRLGTKVVQAHNTAVGYYNYANTGGAVGDHEVGITLPIKAIVRHVFFDVVLQPTTSLAGTLAWKVQSSGDLKTATAVASWTGHVAGVPDGLVGTMIKLTAERKVYAVIASGALTAGKVKVFVDYVVSE